MPSIPFVGREDELRRLRQCLERAVAGEGQIVFVAGEAGSGKTALVSEFVQRVNATDDVVAAVGECNAQTGIGDAYLPFREVLITNKLRTPTRITRTICQLSGWQSRAARRCSRCSVIRRRRRR